MMEGTGGDFDESGEAFEVASLGLVGTCIGIGLLGATGRTYEEAKANRLLEIERHILAIEALIVI